MPNGTLVLVVGPSGVGKDTLIAGARARLADNPKIVFPRRSITRPSDAGGEDHEEISLEAFRAARESGAYALSWEAHGHCYGIPAGIDRHLRDGRHVVVNVSRGVIDEARARYPGCRIACIHASAGTIRARLAARGRESDEEIEKRVARAAEFTVAGGDVATIANDGQPEEGIEALVGLIRQL